jgi:IclR family acetate operon transcriptional repressor
MSETDRPAGSIRSMNSVLNTLRVLEEVAQRQPIGVSELARVTQIPKSSVQRCLITLQQAGWLRMVDREHARWGVTMKALAIGLRGAGEQDLRELAQPVIKRVSADTDETVHFALRDGDNSIIVAREDTSQPVRVFLEIGARIPLQATTAGVAMLAGFEPAEVDEVLKNEITEYEGYEVPGSDELRAELARTRERGYALNMSAWYRPYVVTIGAAVTDPTGRPMAALVLSIPEMRHDHAADQQLAEMVVSAADEISQLISSA